MRRRFELAAERFDAHDVGRGKSEHSTERESILPILRRSIPQNLLVGAKRLKYIQPTEIRRFPPCQSALSSRRQQSPRGAVRCFRHGKGESHADQFSE